MGTEDGRSDIHQLSPLEVPGAGWAAAAALKPAQPSTEWRCCLPDGAREAPEVSPPLPPSPVELRSVQPPAIGGGKEAGRGQLVQRGQLLWQQRQGRCPTRRDALGSDRPRSARLCSVRLGPARMGSAGPGAPGRHWLRRAGRGGAPPLSGGRRRALPGPARLQQAAAAAERAAAGRAGRAGQGGQAPRRPPPPPPPAG